jgi:hypothetical protein
MKIQTALLLALAPALACSSRPAKPGDAAADDAAPPAPDTGTAEAGRLDAGPEANVPPPGPDAAGDDKSPDAQAPDMTGPDLRPDVGPASARSFIIEGKLAATPVNPGLPPAGAPTAHQFTLRLDPVGKTITIGGNGGASRAPATTTDGETWSTKAPLKATVPGGFSCGSPQATYDAFSITVRGNELTGTAGGSMELFMGDVVYRYQVALMMTGRPDVEGPSFGADLDNVDPLAGMFLKASEPLPAASTAALTLDPGVRVELTPFVPMDSGGVVTGFNKPDRALRYGASYALVVSPGSDLAGNAGRPSPALKTLPPPPLAAEDGFEGAGATLGGAQVVQAPFLPPISGTRSAYLAPTGGGAQGSRRLTVRLAVAAGDKVVRFSLRPVFAFQATAYPYGSAIRVAAPGGGIVAATLPGAETPTVRHDTGGGQDLWLGKTVSLEVKLPADVKDEVVLDAAVGFIGCGLPAPVPGYLIDDLRVE